MRQLTKKDLANLGIPHRVLFGRRDDSTCYPCSNEAIKEERFQFMKPVKKGVLTWLLSIVVVGGAELGHPRLQWAGKGCTYQTGYVVLS